MKRIFWIDNAKGFGILLVILGHVILLNSSSTDAELKLASIIYSFHMPLFFILSGVAAAYIKDSRGTIQIARHLLLPYLKWSCIYLLIIFLKSPTDIHSLGERIYATISGRGMAPLWFLVSLALAEFLFYRSLTLSKIFSKLGGYSYC